MQVEITCRHGEIKPDFREYISRKAEKLLTYFERVTAIGVTLDYDSDRVRVEVLVDAEHKHDFVTSCEADINEAGACFDQALQKMEQQIRRYKEKVQDHRRDRPINRIVEGEGT